MEGNLETNGLALRGAMTLAVQHTQVGAPRTDCVAILVGHHARQLMQMSKVVDCPCRQ